MLAIGKFRRSFLVCLKFLVKSTFATTKPIAKPTPSPRLETSRSTPSRSETPWRRVWSSGFQSCSRRSFPKSHSKRHRALFASAGPSATRYKHLQGYNASYTSSKRPAQLQVKLADRPSTRSSATCSPTSPKRGASWHEKLLRLRSARSVAVVPVAVAAVVALSVHVTIVASMSASMTWRMNKDRNITCGSRSANVATSAWKNSSNG